MTSTLHGLLKALLLTLMPTAARTTTGTGSAVNIRGYTGIAVLVLDSGAGGAGNTMDVSLEESADGSTGWTEVPPEAYASGAGFTQVGNAASQQLRRLDLAQRKNHLREKHLMAGGSPNFTYSLSLLAQKIYD